MSAYGSAPAKTSSGTPSGRHLTRIGIVAGGALACLVTAAPAVAAGSPTPITPTRPTVTGLSAHSGPYWGATQVVVTGTNFVNVREVSFGNRDGFGVQVLSSTRLVVFDPEYPYGTVHVRVTTATGRSARTPADKFRFVRPRMTDKIMGGLTGRQEQVISRRVRARHHGVRIAPAARHWTPALGATAVRRARSWLGLPYAWDGGVFSGPTTGACVHNGGDLDCHLVGFDCSGLTLYAWAPYESLDHFSGTQYGQAGRFHPSIGELVPGDLVFFSGDDPGGIGHVAIYTGHGMVIQAPQSGTLVERARLSDVIAESGVYRGATRPMSTGRQGSGPRLALVSAPVPAAGGTVTITGTNLAGVTAVKVGASLIYKLVRHTAHRLVVKVPAHAGGEVRLTVYTAWGSAHRPIVYMAPTKTAVVRTSARTATMHAVPARAAGTRAMRVSEPAGRAARTRFFQDRIGEQWYLVGREQSN